MSQLQVFEKVLEVGQVVEAESPGRCQPGQVDILSGCKIETTYGSLSNLEVILFVERLMEATAETELKQCEILGQVLKYLTHFSRE